MAAHLATRGPPLVLSRQRRCRIRSVRQRRCLFLLGWQDLARIVRADPAPPCGSSPSYSLLHVLFCAPLCFQAPRGLVGTVGACAKRVANRTFTKFLQSAEGGATRLLRALASTSSPKVVPQHRCILWLRGLTVAASPEGEPMVHRRGPPLGHYNCQGVACVQSPCGPLATTSPARPSPLPTPALA